MRFFRYASLILLALTAACTSPRPTPIPTVTAYPPTTTPPATLTATPALVLRIDDFEAAETDWQPGTSAIFSDSSATGLVLTGEHASQGRQSLRLDFAKTGQPKAIFFLDRPLDLSTARYLQFDLYDPGSLAGAGFAVTTGSGAVWYESDSLPVAHSQPVSLTFDLTAATYKAASTNWEFIAKIADLNQVQRLAIILYPAQAGSVYLDNVRLSGAMTP